ncbi:MAG: hypothetical protein ACO1N9_03740 [Flavobacterium sp.]
MKRNVYLLGALAGLAIFTTSCSDDDNDNNTTPQPQTVELYTSSNNSGKVSVTDVSGLDGEVHSFTVAEVTDADGIYYDHVSDQIIQASRTQNRLNIFGPVQSAIDNDATTLTFVDNSSNADFSNPREIAVSGNTVYVAQDQSDANGLTNKIVAYTRSGNTFTRIKSFTVDFKLWGIHADGNNLWAVVDNTGQIAKFENILSNADGAIFPTKRVTIEGLTRTHGITYAANTDTMILTDIGDALIDSDGGIIVIEDFTTVFGNTASGGTIVIGAQNRIYGTNTSLGNPVDVAYDSVSERIYVAERLNGGGRVLTFARPQSSSQNAAPIHSRLEPGVSAVYLSRR